MQRYQVREALKRLFEEDIGSGDITTEAVFSGRETVEGIVKAKEDGIFCGAVVFEEGWRMLDESARIAVHVNEGERIEEGQTLLTVKGRVQALLSGERVLLNLVQRMCGVAEAVRRTVEALNDPQINVCDTRKTMPGLRMFDKYAVRCGGGVNHRCGLYDAVMIKDNHITAAGSITGAAAKVKEKTGHMVKIEIETTSLEEVEEAVEAGADVIMFDNCSPEEAAAWASVVPLSIRTEVSGTITRETIGAYRGTGIDVISAGSITHSVQALDLSFQLRDMRKEEHR
ncbi:carboxylating nicotinate-nucleotide diphosphorylase [Salibacterium halotolerans]|uniref:Probable nicotinate-nucleotide pyrophosphorylase [carboxylating] n=1 Tax=Salibacterium halotolerans TaxID=1884432 RepID=A0A1I5L591_9BACI|nr:carboxylating nicotinate-nucleotide diphosphorylase [Salibacterium halotolerans]SFO92467.1 nicotinate-nucleotide pyrophosphorylase (carboxylating) [Salibacterium halotolerans]